MTETWPRNALDPEEWLLSIAAIPYWTIALALLITVVIFAIFNVLIGTTAYASIAFVHHLGNIQKRFGYCQLACRVNAVATRV